MKRRAPLLYRHRLVLAPSAVVSLHMAVLLGIASIGARPATPRAAKPATPTLYSPISVLFLEPRPVAAPAAQAAMARPRMPATPPSRQMPPPAQLPAPNVTAHRAIASAPATAAPAADTFQSQAESAPPTLAGPSNTKAAASGPNATTASGTAIQAAHPDYAHNPAPDYPLALREQGIGGIVWLRVWVDQDGRPAEIRLHKGSGYRLLDDAALRAVRHWRFIPARVGPQPQASWVEFPIRFTLG